MASSSNPSVTTRRARATNERHSQASGLIAGDGPTVTAYLACSGCCDDPPVTLTFCMPGLLWRGCYVMSRTGGSRTALMAIGELWQPFPSLRWPQCLPVYRSVAPDSSTTTWRVGHGLA